MKVQNALILILLLFLLSGCGADNAEVKEKTYEHVKFTSSIDKETCAICGEHPDVHWAWYMGQDNVAIVDRH